MSVYPSGEELIIPKEHWSINYLTLIFNAVFLLVKIYLIFTLPSFISGSTFGVFIHYSSIYLLSITFHWKEQNGYKLRPNKVSLFPVPRGPRTLTKPLTCFSSSPLLQLSFLWPSSSSFTSRLFPSVCDGDQPTAEGWIPACFLLSLTQCASIRSSFYYQRYKSDHPRQEWKRISSYKVS